MPGVVNGVKSRFISATKMKVGVDGFNVEANDLLALADNDEGKGDVGTKRVLEDVS